MIAEWKNSSKQNKVGQLTIKNYKLKRAENLKFLGVIFNEDNNITDIGNKSFMKGQNCTFRA